MDPRVKVTIEDGGRTVEAEHGLVRLRLDDDELLEPFLGVAAAIIRLLGRRPSPGQVSAGMRRLVRIFDPAQPPRGSVLGLWAELVLVLHSADPRALVDAWHAHVDARFDFSAEGSRLEAKATTRDARVHMFNLRQLKPVTGAEVHVASMMTTETGAGRSVGELVEQLESLLSGDGARQMKVHTMVADTLGSDWARHLGRKFDERQARESLVLLEPAQVPQVEEPPSEVLEVSLTVDCTDVPTVRPSRGLAALVGPVAARGRAVGAR
nr:PD-(D/E)XK motif protein [Nocardioides perillae]